MEGDNLPVSKQNFYFVCLGFNIHTFFISEQIKKVFTV